MIHHFSFPTAISFGAGSRELVGEHLVAHGKRRPLVITDRGVARLPVFAAFLESLVKAGLQPAAFEDVFGNPVRAQVAGAVAAFNRHRADAIVGFGGGAALDVAKAAALMAHHPGDLFDYEDGVKGRGLSTARSPTGWRYRPPPAPAAKSGAAR